MTDLLSETGLTRGLCRNGRDSQLLLEEEGGRGGRRGEEGGGEGGREGGRRGGREGGREEGREGGREGRREEGREGGREGGEGGNQGKGGKVLVLQVLILSPSYNEAYQGSYTTSSLLP